MSTTTQRPTPETDAKYTAVEGLSCLAVIGEMTAFARKLERERDEAREAISGRTVSCSQCNEAARQLEAMREAIKVSLIRAYTAGYQHRHEATVEREFIPVHHSDETEFHAENIHQMLCDGSLPELQPFLKP